METKVLCSQSRGDWPGFSLLVRLEIISGLLCWSDWVSAWRSSAGPVRASHPADGPSVTWNVLLSSTQHLLSGPSPAPQLPSGNSFFPALTPNSSRGLTTLPYKSVITWTHQVYSHSKICLLQVSIYFYHLILLIYFNSVIVSSS